jgi:hypothetical protein
MLRCGSGPAQCVEFSAGNANARARAGNVAARWNLSRRFSSARCSVGTLDGALAIDTKVVLARTKRSARNRDTYKLLPPGIRAVP